jgi:hypothetical protein
MYFVKKHAGCTAKFLEILTVCMFKENHLNAEDIQPGLYLGIYNPGTRVLTLLWTYTK